MSVSGKRTPASGIETFSWAIALLALLLYIPSLTFEFVNWDDPARIYNNPHLGPLSMDMVRWVFTHHYKSNWLPLVWLSFALDITLWGGVEPFGFHFGNVALHALNSLLVVRIFGRLCALAGTRAPLDLLMAVGAGIVFAVHPVHVESVSWATERKDVLFTLFYFLAILFYLDYAEGKARGEKGGVKAYALALVFFLCSLLSKQMAVSLPLVLLLLDYYPLRRFGNNGSPLKVAAMEKLPFYLLAGAGAAAVLWVQSLGGSVAGLESLPLSDRLWRVLSSIRTYFSLSILPLDLVPFHPLRPVDDPFTARYLSSLGFFLLLTILALRYIKRAPVLFVSWLYFLITLAPVVGLVQIGTQETADRYLYISLLGPYALAAWGLGAGGGRLAERFSFSPTALRKSLALLLAAVSLFYGLLCFKQQFVWRSSESLWSKVVEHYPDDSRGYVGLASAAMEDGENSRALELYDRAIEKGVRNGEPFYNRGLLLMRRGEAVRAVEDFSRAIAMDVETRRVPSGTRAEYFTNRAIAYSILGSFEKSVEDFTSAIRLEPEGANRYYNRAVALLQLGKKEEAFEDMRRARKLGSERAAAFLQGVNRGAP